jgi:hypothetical protein
VRLDVDDLFTALAEIEVFSDAMGWLVAVAGDGVRLERGLIWWA